MGVPRCPHCGAQLPTEPSPTEAAADGLPLAADAAAGVAEPVPTNFCPACGRRVEGWKPGYRAELGGAAIGGVLPGSEEPTRAIPTSPSLLRATIASETEPAALSPSDSAVHRAIHRRPWPALVAGALLLGGLVYQVGLRLASAPVAPVAPAPTLAPVALPSIAPPTAPRPRSRQRRISAPPIADARAGHASPSPTAFPVHAASQSGELATKNTSSAAPPHKVVVGEGRTPSPSAKLPAATASAPAELPTAITETLENEAMPMTDAERRADAAARADADGVRFVVRAHLPQVHACYSRAFKESSPGGRVEIGLVVDGNGKATKVRTESNTTDSTALASCLEQRLREWDFPRPSSGEFELIYPFVFSPGN